MAPIIRCGLIALLLLAAGCGADQDDGAAKRAPPAQAAQTCPVCGSSFMASRAVTAEGASGRIAVCSEGCAIRLAALSAPLAASRPSAGREPESDEDK